MIFPAPKKTIINKGMNIIMSPKKRPQLDIGVPHESPLLDILPPNPSGFTGVMIKMLKPEKIKRVCLDGLVMLRG